MIVLKSNSISKSGLSDAQKLSLLERETGRIKASSSGGTTASTKPGIAQVWHFAWQDIFKN